MLKSLLPEALEKIKVPKEPGTVPIPPNYLRLYHYTNASPEELMRHGLSIDKARGHTYGEPDAIWASTKKPENFKTYVEFAVPIDDPRFSRWHGAAPYPEHGVEFYQKGGHDFTFKANIKPEDFIAIHEPWHHHYRYLTDHKDYVEEVLSGQLDHILSDPHLKDEAKAILAVKANFGKILANKIPVE